MHNISEEELQALQAHIEVENSVWLRLKQKILFRSYLVIALLLFRALLLFLFPQSYSNAIFDAEGLRPADVTSLVGVRLLVAGVLASVYLFALQTNRYLRSVTILGLIVPCAMIWADLQMFLISSFPSFTTVATIGFLARLLALYLLARNYIDIRR